MDALSRPPVMRLLELNPKWTATTSSRTGMGIVFDCPVHRTHRLAVMFANPIDGGPPAEVESKWRREGDTFETLSLGPSIDASKELFGELKTPCWHGFITNGEVT